jgi:hypothetical protein
VSEEQDVDRAMRAVADGETTISDKIRALADAGYSKAQTARFLQRSYAHVRNVLKHDEMRGRRARATKPPGVGEGGAAYVGRSVDQGARPIYRIPVGPSGEVRMPAAILREMGWRPEGVIIAETEPDRIVLLSTQASVRRVQDMVRELLPEPGSLADDLIADRRREAALDERDA